MNNETKATFASCSKFYELNLTKKTLREFPKTYERYDNNGNLEICTDVMTYTVRPSANVGYTVSKTGNIILFTDLHAMEKRLQNDIAETENKIRKLENDIEEFANGLQHLNSQAR